jgi:hypothetical protein
MVGRASFLLVGRVEIRVAINLARAAYTRVERLRLLQLIRRAGYRLSVVPFCPRYFAAGFGTDGFPRIVAKTC